MARKVTSEEVFGTGYYWYKWLEGLAEHLAGEGVPAGEVRAIVYG